ncbi:hypothetical protein, partial [Escherichia coli]|uniref:hypothetical protein n=11 Tax=Enterobacterales TaxID=91347 RepID=UPI001BDD72F5
MFLWKLLRSTTETSSFSLHEPSVFFKSFSTAQSPRNPEKNLFLQILAYLRESFAVGGAVTTATARVRVPLPAQRVSSTADT